VAYSSAPVVYRLISKGLPILLAPTFDNRYIEPVGPEALVRLASSTPEFR